LPEGLEAPYAELIRRRIAGESVAYLIGKREFLALDFAVGPGALVPRPETELMVEWGAKWLHGRSQALAVDVGTGSGAIAIGIAHLASPHALRGVIAIEPSFEALRWARKNASTHAHNKPIAFVRGSLVSALAGPIDLVLANLPYLTPEQTDANSDLAVEPLSALVGGDDGLDLIRALIADLPRVLALDGAAILELDPSQADEVAALATATFDRAVVEIIPDLAGLARFVSIDRAPSPVRDVDA
jgi:release factor glutamine methyltransferase